MVTRKHSQNEGASKTYTAVGSSQQLHKSPTDFQSKQPNMVEEPVARALTTKMIPFSWLNNSFRGARSEYLSRGLLPFQGLRELQDVIRRSGSCGGCGEDRLLVVLENLKILRNVLGVIQTWRRGDAQSTAQECRSKFCNQLLEAIGAIGEFLALDPIKTVGCATPMGQFVKIGGVEGFLS